MKKLLLFGALAFCLHSYGQESLQSIYDKIESGKTLMFGYNQNIAGAINPGPIDGCFILTKNYYLSTYNKDCDLSKGQLYNITSLNFLNNQIQIDVTADMYGTEMKLYTVIEESSTGYKIKTAVQNDKTNFGQIDVATFGGVVSK